MKILKKLSLALLVIVPGILIFAENDQLSENVSFSHSSDAYNEDIQLKIGAPADTKIYISFINVEEEPVEDNPSWVLYREPLELSALYGEERFYLLRVKLVKEETLSEEYNLPYIIDKRPPLVPEVNIPPGEYTADLNLSLTAEESIFYTVNGNILEDALEWTGEPIRIATAQNGIRHFLVQAYAQDAAGNRSKVVSYNYNIHSADPESEAPLLKVLSPVEGSFANYQMLCILSRNLEWIRYSIDGSDPLKNGTEYKSEHNLILTGNISLQVAALTNRGDILKRSVAFQVLPAYSLKILSDVQNGIYPDLLQIGLYCKENSKIYYNFSEREPVESDFLYRNSIIINPVKDTLKYTVLRAKAKDPQNGWGREHRFFYGIDDRQIPEETDLTAEVIPEPEDLIRVERIGSEPANSPVVLRVYSEQKRPIMFEIAQNTNPPLPTVNSPLVNGDLVLSVPYGIETNFHLRFASTDKLGQLTFSEGIIVSFDRKPPGLPEFSFPPGEESYDTGLKLVLSGEGDFEYEISDDGTIPPDPTEGSTVFKNLINMSGVDGKLTSYFLKIRCKDQLGNTSVTFGPFIYRIDLRIPKLPRISGVRNGSTYNSKTVSLSLEQGNVHVHYSVSTDGDPPDPTVNSPILKDHIDFTGQEGAITRYRIKFLTYSKYYQLSGDITSLTFEIDLIKPAVPQAFGFEDGARYNRPVSVSLEPADPEHVIYVSFTDDGTDAPDPVSFGIQYTEPLTFDAPQGQEKLVELRAVALSKNKNRSYPDQFYRFTIDKEPPLDPQVIGIPVSGFSSESVRLGFESSEGKIYYTITDDGTIPRLPMIVPENQYSSMLYLPGKEGQEITYRIAARAVDDLGNTSSGLKIYTVTVDKKPPESLSPPQIIDYWDGLRRRTILSWKVPPGHRLMYRLIDRDESFQEYTEPLIIDAPGGESGLNLSAYLEDKAGNRSQISSFVQYPERKPARPEITGLKAGGISNKRVTLTVKNPEGIIRYELSVDGTRPADVTPLSPTGQEIMSFDCEPGEQIEFKINIRVYHPDKSELFSDLVSREFTIDKSPPLAPGIEGAANGGYYLESRFVSLKSEEGSIFYALSQGSSPAELEDASFIPYAGEIALDGREGEQISYRIAAYTIDRAGNRSRSDRVYNFTIDKKGIYVSESGNDYFEGTRERPFRTIERGVDYSFESGRKIMYISAGNFELIDPLVLDGTLRVQGGYDPSWSRITGKTVVRPVADFEKSGVLIRIAGGSLDFDSLDLGDPSGGISCLIEVENGRLEITNSILRREIVQNNGELIIKDCRLEAGNVGQGFLLSSSGSNLEVSDSEFQGPDSGSSYTTVVLEGESQSKWERVTFLPGRGKVTRAINATDSNLSIRDCTVSTGGGTINAVALELKHSELELSGSVIRNDPYSHYSVGILASDSEMRINADRFELNGRYGAIGIKTSGGISEITLSRFFGEKALEFIYLVNISGGRSFFYNNILCGGESGDSVCVFLKDAESDWFNNTILGGTGNKTCWGFHINSDKLIRLVNNILTRHGDPSGTAFSLTALHRTEMITNCIYGWESFLVKTQTGRITDTISGIDELNAADGSRRGGPFNGNITESPYRTFTVTKGRDYHLASASQCVNAGSDLSRLPFNGPDIDIDGQKRPADHVGVKPTFDIGADELY